MSREEPNLQKITVTYDDQTCVLALVNGKCESACILRGDRTIETGDLEIGDLIVAENAVILASDILSSISFTGANQFGFVTEFRACEIPALERAIADYRKEVSAGNISGTEPLLVERI